MSEAPVQYARPLIPPGSACAGCGATELLVRDHCHEHGWVRAIACRRCNKRLDRIDRGFAPRVEEELLIALVAVRNRCPDCDRIDVANLIRPEPPESAKRKVVKLSAEELKEKTRENRLRRMAERQGYKLARKRSYDPGSLDYGTFHLVPAELRIKMRGEREPVGPLTIDEVERHLTG